MGILVDTSDVEEQEDRTQLRGGETFDLKARSIAGLQLHKIRQGSAVYRRSLCHGYSPGSFLLCTVPPGTVPPGSVPPGTMPPGTVPPGKVLLGNVPPGTVPPGRVPPGNVPPGTVPPGNVPPAGVLSRPERPVRSPVFPERRLSIVLPDGLDESPVPAGQSEDITRRETPKTMTSGAICLVTAWTIVRKRVLVSEPMDV
ncbi:MAG: hypothetical protein CV088_06950 [Nitrospira sp. LK70]|nr:hypothetical protein [Nitrospira sp. LK70]